MPPPRLPPQRFTQGGEGPMWFGFGISCAEATYFGRSCLNCWEIPSPCAPSRKANFLPQIHPLREGCNLPTYSTSTRLLALLSGTTIQMAQGKLSGSFRAREGRNRKAGGRRIFPCRWHVGGNGHQYAVRRESRAVSLWFCCVYVCSCPRLCVSEGMFSCLSFLPKRTDGRAHISQVKTWKLFRSHQIQHRTLFSQKYSFRLEKSKLG